MEAMRDLSISDSRSDSSSPAPNSDIVGAATAQSLWSHGLSDPSFQFSQMMYNPSLTSQMTTSSSCSTSSTPLHSSTTPSASSTAMFDFAATAQQQYLYQSAYNPWAYQAYGFQYQPMYTGATVTDAMGFKDVTIPSSNRSSTATTPNASMATLSWAMASEGKKKRQPYKKDQISRLEYEYKINPYLTNKRRSELSLQLMLDEKQVKVWFQNRRMKDKKLRQRVSGPFPHGELMIPCNERLIN
ncbi:hypothetical protein L3Y34_002616 [Caenorhabditis briggsae]|uniref:Homeobox domain-containing protein n=2 Tax=Caenorhabditis briggsae TaxID=6238 RepID=A0AAE9DF82_CAEBR|nr:hypothetical protein L3Y34_002616 [Caenorhabditis briggsae]